MKRYEISEKQWNRIKDKFPPEKKPQGGRPGKSNLEMLNAILYWLNTGIAYAKFIADRFDLSKYEGRKLNLAQEMYAYAMPRQYTMLVDCPYVIVPLFKCAKLNAEWVSKLNPLTTAWCVAENIMLAVVNEGLGYSLRIPLNKEHNIVLEKLGVPAGWMTPCFIGIGYPKEDELILEQYDTNPDKHIHTGAW